MLSRSVVDHYRTLDEVGSYAIAPGLPKTARLFRYGEYTAFGRVAGLECESVRASSFQLEKQGGPDAVIPFDVDEVIENYLLERYTSADHNSRIKTTINNIVTYGYYRVRPALPVIARKYLQKAYLRDRLSRSFPEWPVDRSVERMRESIVAGALRTMDERRAPFIWFWPRGKSGCVIITHDVETGAGRDFCSNLMDIDDAMGIKAAYQIVPEGRYAIDEAFLAAIRGRGCEINIHDLNHDGRLYSSAEKFRRRVQKINFYGRMFGARGFRSAVLYRNPGWFSQLQFSYDMSIPNAAHMDPQSGGCCTVFPYFIGNILEIPVTLTQDYTLLHVLGYKSIELWQKQIESIMGSYGLISCIVHPDYVIDGKSRELYLALLHHLRRLCVSSNLWVALPREVDAWWRARHQMHLVQQDGIWRIHGPRREEACVAYAELNNERVSYLIDAPVAMGPPEIEMRIECR